MSTLRLHLLCRCATTGRSHRREVMPPNIRDLAALERAADALPELISVCKRPGSVYGVDNALAADVTRKAKGLQTSLGKLRAAVDDPAHRPTKEKPPMPKDPLVMRLHFQPVLYD